MQRQAFKLPGPLLPSHRSRAPEGCDELRLGIDDNNSAFDHAHELGKTIQAVRVNAVAARFGKKLCAKPSAVFLETQIDENFQEN